MKTSFIISKSLLLMAILVLVGFSVSCDNADEEGLIAI